MLLSSNTTLLWGLAFEKFVSVLLVVICMKPFANLLSGKIYT